MQHPGLYARRVEHFSLSLAVVARLLAITCNYAECAACMQQAHTGDANAWDITRTSAISRAEDSVNRFFCRYQWRKKDHETSYHLL